MSTTTYTNPDGSTSTIVIPDPVVTVAPPVVTVGDATYTWTPAPVPAVATSIQTLFGDTPRTASTAAGVAAVDADYGVAGEVIRLYCSTALAAPAVTDRKVIGSFKTMPGSTANFGAYWRLFYQHEINSKVKKGAITLLQWQKDMAVLAALNLPGLGVCLTAYCFDPASGQNPADYLVPGVTHLGVDFDGISGGTSYHDYSAALKAVVAFAKAHGLTWGVPEFGANRLTNDADGSGRAAWLTYWAGKFQQSGAEYVCLWEYETQTGSTFTTPAEVATVRTMLALGPRA
jgi:hypothetical protein